MLVSPSRSFRTAQKLNIISLDKKKKILQNFIKFRCRIETDGVWAGTKVLLLSIRMIGRKSSLNVSAIFTSGVYVMLKSFLKFTIMMLDVGSGMSDVRCRIHSIRSPWLAVGKRMTLTISDFLLYCACLDDKARGSHDTDWCLNGISGTYSSLQASAVKKKKNEDSRCETEIFPENC